MAAYYNENDPHAAAWLRELIAARLIPDGEIDERSICEIDPVDLLGFDQAHFFAGIGGWPYAARLAGWPDDRPLWTGSCPCQPFSVAGKRAGRDDPRHLWPHFHRLIRACRPPVVMGEQVAGKAGLNWFDGVRADLAGDRFAGRCVDIPALAVDGVHIRQRIYWIAVPLGDTRGPRLPAPEQQAPIGKGRRGEGRAAAESSGASVPGGDMEHPESFGRGEGRPKHEVRRWRAATAGTSGRNGTHWSDAEWLVGADGKARRAKPGIRLLAHGVPGRVGLLRGFGNAIVPQLAAEVIAAFMDIEP